MAGNSVGVRALGGTIDFNSGTTLSGRLLLTEEGGVNASVVRGVDTVLQLHTLAIEGASHIDFVEGDSLSNLLFLSDGATVDAFTALDISNVGVLESDSVLSFFQADGQLDGLALGELQIDGSSLLSLTFDNLLAGEDELDFALRVLGDRVSLLESLITGGQISVVAPDSLSIGVIRDTSQFGDFTYVGYVGTAVPEPGSAIILALLGCGFLIRRRC